MNHAARGAAGGKVILLGEHAVVYGRPALAAGIGIEVRVDVTAGAGPMVVSDRAELADDPRPLRLLVAAAECVGADPRGLVARVRSALPVGSGLGSSAALTIAMLRAVATARGYALDRAAEIRLGRQLEAIFHGRPSGIDPAAAALGACCFRFVAGDPPTITAVRPKAAVPLVIALGGGARSTGVAVGGLRERWTREPARYERVFDEVGAVVESGVHAVERGDLSTLGRAFDANQDLLAALGVSAPEVEALVAACRQAGALGAKLTGGGAGGAAIAVADDANAVSRRLDAVGVRTHVVSIETTEGEAA